MQRYAGYFATALARQRLTLTDLFPCALQAYSKARADALARVGSRSPAAEAVGQLLLWGHPAAWLPTPIMSALLELVAQDPEGEDAELVQGAYQLVLNVSKVG
jgi:hypothetical protein